MFNGAGAKPCARPHRYRMAHKSVKITQVESDQHSLTLQWEDGHRGEFDLLWLRDNCSCEICGDRSVGRKQVSILQLPESPAVASARIESGSTLEVVWADDGHPSHYGAEWLRQHCYCDQCRERRRFRPTLWDQSLQIELPEFEFSDVESKELTRLNMLKQIVDKGLALIHHVPVNQQGFESLLSHIGFIKETNYGRICDLKVNTGGELIGDTDLPIPLHTDEGYRHANPGMLAFHCLSTSDDGGGANLLADGFNLANTLREVDHESYEFLCRTPMVARRMHLDEVDLRSAAPVISVDCEGNIQGIRYNERSAAPLDLCTDEIRPAYRALKAWLTLTRDVAFQIRIYLKPGDVIVFDNQRVLHGRDEFRGNRHLLYAQLDLDEPHSRHRILSERHGVEHSISTHRGT